MFFYFSNSYIKLFIKIEGMKSEESENNENPSQRQKEKKRARRTRKDEDGRDYKCSCGKSYLSYPALYTHIKTKHDGKAPQKIAEEEDRTNTKQDLEQLKILLAKFYPERIRGASLAQLSQVLSQQERAYIMPQLNYWQNQQKNEKNEKSQSEPKKLLSARQVFGKLVYDMNKRTNPTCIKFLVKLIMWIHKGVCAQKKQENYFDDCTASMIPSLFNQLILNGHIPIDKNSGQKILQDSQAVCSILVHMCYWMFNQKYTNYTVKYRL